jgi:subtilisin family serine protease
VPWHDNGPWDERLGSSNDIAVAGTRRDERRSTVFLRRPGQMVCDSGVWNDPADEDERELRERLGAAGAEETRGAPQRERDELRADAADRLGLTLLNVPDEQQLELFREGRRLVPDAFSFNHVLVAGPQRFGGDAPPEDTEASVDIPAAAAKGTKTIAVLDTGIVEGAPFSVLPDPDIEPAVADSPAAGHGTMVAGVVRRYAPSALILIKRVLNMPLGEADELEIAAALNALPPVDIVNASFGGPAADETRMVALQRALDDLPAETLVVAAAGNEGMRRRHYMAAFKGVLAVGSAASVDGQLGVCFYSNRGRWVDVSTQGSDVETVRGPSGRVRASGTSFAAPKVAATLVGIMEEQGIGARHAASWLTHQSGGTPIAGGGTFIDLPES